MEMLGDKATNSRGDFGDINSAWLGWLRFPEFRVMMCVVKPKLNLKIPCCQWATSLPIDSTKMAEGSP